MWALSLSAVALVVLVGCASKGTSRLPDDGSDAAAASIPDDAGSAAESSGPEESTTKVDASADDDGHVEAASDPSCASLPLCDGFEGDTPGMAPDPAVWKVLMGCNPNTTNAEVDGGLTIGVDDSVAHAGRNSLRVVGGDSCGYYAINVGAFARLPGQLYARFYARFSGPPTPNHNGFLSMYSGSATDFLSTYSSSEQLRLGFQGSVVVWNYLSSDATLPDIDSAGEAESTVTHPGAWDCIEFHLDPTSGAIEFWLNGAGVAGLTYGGTSVQSVSDNWHTGGPTSLELKSFGLGWLGLNDQYVAWFDDVALSDSRIHCL